VIQHLLLEHLFIIFVDHVAVVVNQVPFAVHFAALSIYFVSFCIFVQDRVAQRIHFEVTQHVFEIELGEWQNLWDLIIV